MALQDRAMSPLSPEQYSSGPKVAIPSSKAKALERTGFPQHFPHCHLEEAFMICLMWSLERLTAPHPL